MRVTTQQHSTRPKLSVYVDGEHVGYVVTTSDVAPVTCIGILHPDAKATLEAFFPGRAIVEPSVIVGEDGRRIVPWWKKGSQAKPPHYTHDATELCNHGED